MKYSKDGYKRTSKDKNNPYNVIPSGNITMKGVDFPVFGMDNLGNSRVMMPGANYTFPGSSVFEIPLVQNGGNIEDKATGQGFDPEMMFRDKYNTELTEDELTQFTEWVKSESARQGRDIMMDMGAYDIQGFWKSGDFKKMDEDNHGSDKWKKPNHPTFSNQSVYHNVDGFQGGTWQDDGGYIPSEHTKKLYNVEYYNWLFGREPHRPEYLVLPKNQKGGSVSWQWKGKTYSGTLIPSMETATNRYARTKNGKIKTLPKGQGGGAPKKYIGKYTTMGDDGVYNPYTLTDEEMAIANKYQPVVDFYDSYLKGNTFKHLYNKIIDNTSDPWVPHFMETGLKQSQQYVEDYPYIKQHSDAYEWYPLDNKVNVAPSIIEKTTLSGGTHISNAGNQITTKSRISIDPQNEIIGPFNTEQQLGIMAHELGHTEGKFFTGSDKLATEINKRNKAYQRVWNNLSEEDKKRMTENPVEIDYWLSDNYDSSSDFHDAAPEEVRSDVIRFRYLADKAGIYDSSGDYKKFNESDLKKMKEQFGNNRLFRHFEDEDIIWLMDNVAQQTPDGTGNPYEIVDDFGQSSFLSKDGGQLPKAQDGSMFDLKGYFRGEQGLIPDLYGKTTKQTYKENKDNVQKGLDVVSATGIPFVSQAANLGSSAIDFGDAYSAYKSGDMDTYNQELAKATTNVTLGMVPGVKQAKLIKNVAQGVGENIVKTGINTATKYGAKSGIKSGVDEAVDAISGKAMFGGEVYRYERSPFKNGKFVISNPADLIIEITKTEVFTPEFKMGGSVKMNEFNLEKKFDKDKKLPYIEYTGEPDIEGRVYYDDETNEIVDVTTLELRKQRKHDRIKMIIDKYESDIELSSAEKEALNSLGLLD